MVLLTHRLSQSSITKGVKMISSIFPYAESNLANMPLGSLYFVALRKQPAFERVLK